MIEVQLSDGSYEWVSEDDLEAGADYYDKLLKKEQEEQEHEDTIISDN